MCVVDKKVLVVIPVYNTEKYVEKTVLSVVNQTHKNVQILLVDDGSPDNAPQICDDLVGKFNNVSVIHKKNGGLSSARNTGIEQITSDIDFVFFLDSDDTVLPNAISDMVALAQEKNADVVLPNEYLCVNEGDNENINKAVLFPANMCYEEPKNFVLHTMIENCRGWRATGILYSANTVKANNCAFPLGRISEDVIFNLQFFSYVQKIAFYNSPTIKVLKRSGSITHTFQNGFDETIYFIDEKSREFLVKTDLDENAINKSLDAMLCRNIVVFLFSIMSSNNPMKFCEKKRYVKKILSDKRSRSVFRRKQILPWFESKKTRMGMRVIYTLLRLRLDFISIILLSFLV